MPMILKLLIVVCSVVPEQATAPCSGDTAVLHPLVTAGITTGLRLKSSPGKKVKCGEPAYRHLFDIWIVHLLLSQNLWEGVKTR